ncbi:MAG: rhodanese-like domain-containing protein [Pirellulaceae bacterium]|nr:rhodanese-like domain-containing protein [Pirellulaceae bacterium]
MATATSTTTTTISPQQLLAAASTAPNPDLIDVRTPMEYREVHVEFARNVPLDQLDPQALMQSRSTTQPLYVICKSGGRGRQACDRFHAAGYTNVMNVEGGTQACEQAGLPVVRGKKAMSLERQVRIAAGGLVLIGVGLGFVNSLFFGISAFVGAGLMFAGITDYCGMGMMLARMPWNK